MSNQKTSQGRHPERSEGSPEVGTVLNSENRRAKRRAEDGWFPIKLKGAYVAHVGLLNSILYTNHIDKKSFF